MLLVPADEKDAIARLAKVASSVTQAADVEPAARARGEIEASLKALESKVKIPVFSWLSHDLLNALHRLINCFCGALLCAFSQRQ